MSKDLWRLFSYYLYLLAVWGGFRFFVDLPEVITELWFKPIIFLVPLFWWRASDKKVLELFSGKTVSALEWGLLGGLVYFIILRSLTNLQFSWEVNRVGIALITAVVEELVFSGIILSILIRETRREGLSLAITGLAVALTYLPRQIFVFSLDVNSLVGAFSLAFFVGIINGFLRLRSKNVVSAMIAHFVFLLLILSQV